MYKKGEGSGSINNCDGMRWRKTENLNKEQQYKMNMKSSASSG